MKNSTINLIPYSVTASGVCGQIAGRYWAAVDDQALLSIANRQYPHLLFKLHKLN